MRDNELRFVASSYIPQAQSPHGLWRLLLTLQQQPPQTGATPIPFGTDGAWMAEMAPEWREWRLNGGMAP